MSEGREGDSEDEPVRERERESAQTEAERKRERKQLTDTGERNEGVKEKRVSVVQLS